MTDFTYLDVAAVRIQEWIGRTHELRLRRGASVMLSAATARERWAGQWPPGTEWNDEAGDVAGVVSLRLSESVDPVEVAWQVAAVLRGLLPACSFTAGTCSGATYLQALHDRRTVLDDQPPAWEVVVAKPCDACRAAPATREFRHTGSTAQVCADCALRHENAGWVVGGSLEQAPAPERRLRQAWTLHYPGSALGIDDTFADVAARGRNSADDAATQVALIYADGNRLGAFLHALAVKPSPGLAKADIVPAVQDATSAALVRALAAARRAAGEDEPSPAADGSGGAITVPLIAHIADGDDVLVTVPATWAWPFVVELLDAFGAEVRARLGKPAQAASLSMSAGVVFAHLSHPFADVAAKAGGLLREAKSEVDGRAASVAWLDLTADGDSPPAGRSPLRLAWLQANAGLLSRVAARPASQRSSLLRQVRIGDVDELARLITRVGSGPFAEVLGSADLTAAGVAQRCRSLGAEAPRLIRQAVDLARYWPPAAVPAAGATGEEARR